MNAYRNRPTFDYFKYLPSAFIGFADRKSWFATWVPQFMAAFIPAFVSTGVLLGVIYVLVARAMRFNRKDIEEWCESLRQRLQSGPVPIIERSQPVMISALYAIYGRTPTRRLAASFIVAVFFSATILGTVYWRYTRVSEEVHQRKARLEREADPKLYSYVTDPMLRPEYVKAGQQRYVREGTEGGLEYVYDGGIYTELRERSQNFQSRLVARIFADPASVELTLLFIIEGNYLDPGFQGLDSMFLFGFNVLLDFLSVTIIIVCLRRLGNKPSFRTGIQTFGYALCGTLGCAIIAFLSYRLFFRGNTGFFWQLLILLPLSLGATLIGIVFIVGVAISYFRGNELSNSERIVTIAQGAFIGLLGIQGLRYFWSFSQSASLGIVKWRDIFSLPYVLAGTTLLPATLSVIAFCLILIAKVVVEPGRVLPEAYMTFVKDEVGGTQASGFIVIISVLIGVVVGLIYGSPH